MNPHKSLEEETHNYCVAIEDIAQTLMSMPEPLRTMCKPTREVLFFLSVDDKCYTEHEVIDLVRYATKALNGCPRCLAKPGQVHLRYCKV